MTRLRNSALWAFAASCSLCTQILRAEPAVDTALIVAVDVSQSVDEKRYRLQMEGIAQALEDPGVVAVITGGATGKLLFSMVTWSDDAHVIIGWRIISSQAEASAVADVVRNLPLQSGEFTCMARMMRKLSVSILPNLPVEAGRIVIDVSGDGPDNCSDLETLHAERDNLLRRGVTINGLPIFAGAATDAVGASAYRAPGFGLRELQIDRDPATLDQWFHEHVVGGPGAFLLPAHGYEDFGRAMRQKFVIEISAASHALQNPAD